jgi:hypothetical protein
MGPCGADDRWFALPAVGLTRRGTSIPFAALWTEIRWLDRHMAFMVARRERGRRGAWLGGDEAQARSGLLARRFACGRLSGRWIFLAAELQPPTKHDGSRARYVNVQT